MILETLWAMGSSDFQSFKPPHRTTEWKDNNSRHNGTPSAWASRTVDLSREDRYIEPVVDRRLPVVNWLRVEEGMHLGWYSSCCCLLSSRQAALN